MPVAAAPDAEVVPVEGHLASEMDRKAVVPDMVSGQPETAVQSVQVHPGHIASHNMVVVVVLPVEAVLRYPIFIYSAR